MKLTSGLIHQGKQILPAIGQGLLALCLFLGLFFFTTNQAGSPVEGQYHGLYRFGIYLSQIFRGDMGTNAMGVQVMFFLGPALRYSLRLLIPSLLGALVVAVVLAQRAFQKNTMSHGLPIRGMLALVNSVPIYWFALVFFSWSIRTRWFPIGGVNSPGFEDMALLEQLIDTLRHFFLPWVAGFLYPAVVITDYLEQFVEQQQSQPWVIASRVQGLEKKYIARYQLTKVLISQGLTKAAQILPVLITNQILIEMVFNIPGLGSRTFLPFSSSAMGLRDLAVSRGGAAYLAIGSIGIQTLLFSLGVLFSPPGLGTSQEPLSTYEQHRSFSWIPLAKNLRYTLGVMLLVLVLWVLGWIGPRGDSSWIVYLAAGLLLLAGLISLKFTRPRDMGQPTYTSKALVPRIQKIPGTMSYWGFLCMLILVLLHSFAWLSTPPRGGIVYLRYVDPTLSWLGDFLPRLVIATRVFFIPVLAAFISVLIGTLVGFFVRVQKLDWVITILQLIRPIPAALLLMIFSLLTKGSLDGLLWVLLILGMTEAIQVGYQWTKELSLKDYWSYSQLLGQGSWNLLFQHVLPARGFHLVQNFFTSVANLTILQVNLSFLGRFAESTADERFPVPGVGVILRETRSMFIRGQWHVGVITGLVFLLYILLLRLVARSIIWKGGES